MQALPPDPASVPGPAHDDGEVGALPVAPRPRTATLAAIALGGAGLLTALFLAGLLPKLHHQHALKEETAATAGAKPRVSVQAPRRMSTGQGVSLPGNVQALRETTVFARTSGYVKRRLVDIGDHVSEGQLLAELETPDLHQELLAAQAARGEAQAALEQSRNGLAFSRVNVDRARLLKPEGLTPQQDLDQREAAFTAAGTDVRRAEASLRSASAKLAQLAELESFARVTAPFAGTVTARSTEVGALVTAGNGVGQALFKVAQVDRLRVLTSVPQAYAPRVRVGEKARVTVRELKGRVFAGTITRSAGSLDAGSRTLLTEVEVPNDDGALLPGMYATVDLDMVGVDPPLLVPASALIVSAEGTSLATVDADNRVHLIKVTIEGDYGAELGIGTGLAADARVVSNPGERLREGLEVEVAVPAPAASASAKK
jgi:RND family efflux transporter MFP subunit